MVKRSTSLEGKTYIIEKNKSIYAREFKSYYKKVIDDYSDRKIKQKRYYR